jgi:tetratricopeptide (TPR) repeat protein
MYQKNFRPFYPVLILFLLLQLWGFNEANAQMLDLTPRERDQLRSQSISLVKEFEQLLNVLSHKATTTSDAQDIVVLATSDNQTRIFADPKVVLEDDLYSIHADSTEPKDVSIQKYLNDWDLFYTKGFEETVSFSDLRISDFAFKGYLYLKVYYVSQFKNKHKYFDKNYVTKRRVATIRFDKKNGKYVGYINGISFFRSKRATGNGTVMASPDDEFKPFVKEIKMKLNHFTDSTITESQIALQRKSDSLYAEAVKSQVQKSEEEQRRDVFYSRAISKGDSMVVLKDFASAIEAYTEARAFKPLETYPRTKINELTRILAGGLNNNPRQMFTRQMSEGDAFFKQRDYEAARQAYQSAYIILPDNPEVIQKFYQTDKIIRNKAEIRRKYMAGNFKLALKDYTRIISEDKTNPDYFFERARCYLALGENKKAMADLNSAISLDPVFAEALKMRSSSFQKDNELFKAIADLNTLTLLNPGIAEYHQQKGFLLAQGKEYDKAVDEFNLALKLDPKDVQSATAKADAQRKSGRLDEALVSAEAALSINSGYSSALFMKGMILMQKGYESRAGVEFSKAYKLGLNVDEAKELDKYHDDYLNLARTNARNNQQGEAIKFVQKALLVKPVSVDALYFLAVQEAAMGKTADAIRDLDQCIALKENFVPAYVKKGQILSDQKDFRTALPLLHTAFNLDNRNLDACRGLGDAFVAQSAYDSALVWFNTAFLIKSADPVTLVKRARCHYSMENYHKALLDVENAIREDNKLAEAHFYKGKINKALKQGFTAIDNYSEAARLGYNKYDCLVETGLTYVSISNHKQAIKAYGDAIVLQSGQSDAYALRAASYKERDDFKNAQADYEAAIRIDSMGPNPDCLSELGFIHVRSGNFTEAQPRFEKALIIDPNHPGAGYGLGVVLFQQGKKEAALQSFEKAFQTGKLEFGQIKKDVWMKEILKDPDFIKLKEAGFK